MKIQDKIIDIIDKNMNAFTILLSIITTILVVYNINGAWKWLAWFPFVIYAIWSFIIFSITILIERSKPDFDIDKNEYLRVMQGLNICKKDWKKISNQEKEKLRNYYKTNYYFNKEWENLSIEKKIKIVNEDNIKQQEDWRKRQDELAAEKIKEKEELEKLKKVRILKAQQEKKILEENKLRQIEIQKQKEITEREAERLKREELRKIKVEEDKKRRDEEHKEFIKSKILEDQKKKQLEAEAIQELIDAGLIDNNHYSGKNIRESIPTNVKTAVWNRDKQRCINCSSNTNLEFDHNIPVSKGGANTINNIQLLCMTCNRKKSNKIM